ncbi:hypothetical protein [uncultured Brachyspira sp.]|nr:hypothetical protein [uncultured Brachyspira sp.]
MTIELINNFNDFLLLNDDEYRLLIDEYNDIINNYDKEFEKNE